MIRNILCQICGEKATGSHFSAITCESCKSFFRRNAINKVDQFKCFLGGNCLIDRKNRNTCKKCRLNKCFVVGMKISLILSEEQKQLRKSIIKSNRKSKLSDTSVTTDESAVSTAGLSPQTLATFTDEINLDINFENILPQDNNLNNIFDLQTFSVNYIANDTNLYQMSQSVVPIVRPISDYSNTFNELEGNRLTELLNAMKTLAIPAATNGNRLVLNTFAEAINTMITRQEIEIHNLVKLSKTISVLNSLCENDQMILIKYSAIKIKTLRMFLEFDFEMQAWNLGNISRPSDSYNTV
ncbi:unnamed protein product [Medioppia subpectinata]|uniref:Nuclear receptor domain-containing protein n=1 Tax=Medioppia subpectinata TaxID=1979941 RepID=A0A7R9PSW9_9ACAR|nr:unnamed protein product [Medioppia subpectinata]CAG2100063.1 unnamed protein product [Medioppia subpectinata]